MEWAIGLAGFVAILVLMGLGAHVSVAIGLPAIVGLFILLGMRPTFEVVSTQLFRLATDYSFTAVPLFLLMGYVAMVSGITGRAFDAAAVWTRRVPGGLAVAACIASVPIGACMGSGVSATVALSKMAIPEMIKHKYDKSLAAATIASASTIDVLVPPSVMMVVYAVYTEASLREMLIAGYLPALVSIAFYIAYILVRVRLNPGLAPEKPVGVLSWRERLRVTKDSWAVVLLFLVLFLGLYSGYFTATESAAVAALTAFILMAVLRKFSWSAVRKGFVEAIETSAVLFLILMASTAFVVFIGVSGLPQTISDAIVAANLSPYAFIALIMILYLVMGCFLPAIAMLLLTIPIFMPVMDQLGINLIWFGILFIKMSMIGAITPPFGLSLFIVKGIMGDELSYGQLYRGIWPFVAVELVSLTVLIAFPAITLWLPNVMLGAVEGHGLLRTIWSGRGILLEALRSPANENDGKG